MSESGLGRLRGVSIHSDHPFADPPSARDVVRRFRGRLAAGVTLWAAGSEAGRKAGLTVSSLMVANGTPARVVALLDPLSDLVAVMGETGRAAVSVLNRTDRALADAFAGLVPAPGGPFRLAEFTDERWGPVLTHAQVWAGLRLEATQEMGWSLLVTGVLEQISLVGDADPLVHYRGRYVRVAESPRSPDR